MTTTTDTWCDDCRGYTHAPWCPASTEQPRPEQASSEASEFERDYYAEFQQQRTAKYPAKVLAELLAAGEINREQYERLRRESVEHEHDAPAAPERDEWRIVETVTRTSIANEHGEDIAVGLGRGARQRREHALQIVTEHKQHSTLVAQREHLKAALNNIEQCALGIMPIHRDMDHLRQVIIDANDARWTRLYAILAEARVALTASEQEGMTQQ